MRTSNKSIVSDMPDTPLSHIVPGPTGGGKNVAYYQSSVGDFLTTSSESILGELAKSHGFSLELLQKRAWLVEIDCLRAALARFPHGVLLLEFAIPRMGKRADAVLLLGETVVVLEFKTGATSFDQAALDQVHDYALDLKNFHAGSHVVPIVPIVVATDAPAPAEQAIAWAADRVAQPVRASSNTLARLLEQIGECLPADAIIADQWLASGYKPTPTIIEAAQALYHQHGVEEITRSDSGAKNLTATTESLQRIINQAKAERRKAICLVTGVPGSGKTLAGLNIATKRAEAHEEEHAVFLSGNGPLVEVLREALARDKATRDNISKQDAMRQVRAFIQPIHHFRDEALKHARAPIERVIVFDEAQRAWTREKATKFMRDRGNSDFNASEPEFLISVMDRHEGWCVIICLVGGGQEINTGEAGLLEWLAALHHSFPEWDIHISNRLSDPDYISPESETLLRALAPDEDEDLHLSVSMRSFRAESLSSCITHVIENRPDQARQAYSLIADRYPIAITRKLEIARAWLKSQARGSERYGMLASSGGRRLKPEGLDVRVHVEPPAWFLNDRTDVRSAFYCEDVATEFDVQGLELDWCAVGWDADLRHNGSSWECFRFKGTKWQVVNNAEAKVYLKNAYRVLLTRARQGMVIFVPLGDDGDPTRPPAYYHQTHALLRRCGFRDLDRHE